MYFIGAYFSSGCSLEMGCSKQNKTKQKVLKNNTRFKEHKQNVDSFLVFVLLWSPLRVVLVEGECMENIRHNGNFVLTAAKPNFM